MSHKVRYIIISIMSILAVGLLYFNYTTSKENGALEHKIHQTKVPKKQELNRKLTPQEVAETEKVIKAKIDDFLIGKYKDDTSGDGSAYDVLRGLFTPTAHHIILKEDSSEKDIIEYYDPFEYKLSNVSGRLTQDGKEMFMNVDVVYDGRKINEAYTLMSFTLDDNNKMIGGMLYGKSE